jgi:hypothetical protein
MKIVVTLATVLFLTACQNPSGNPELASAPYPMNLHVSNSVPIQVIRDGEFVKIVNSTADDYNNATLWVNQRFSGKLTPLLAGDTMRLNLWELRDSFGEQFNAGGIWRTDDPTELVIAELQIAEDAPLVGLVVIGQQE